MLSRARACLTLAATAVAFVTGCAGKVEMVRTVTPNEARQSGLAPIAIVRGEEKIQIPENARLEGNRVVVPFRDKVGPNDVMEQDAVGRIVAIRHPEGETVHFVPGTATFVGEGDEIRGEVEGAQGGIPLRRGDRIQVRGTFDTDETLPGGGHFERSHATGLLVGGATVLLLSYAPSAYIGAISPRKEDRVLFVPVVGPFLDFANRPGCSPSAQAQMLSVDPCIEEKASRGVLIASGAVQSFGALLFAFGLPARTHFVAPREAAKPTIKVVPTTNGAAAFGTF